MTVDEIKTVLIIGSGTMGQQIGFTCALHGYSVMVYDLSNELLDNAEKMIERLSRGFVNSGRVTAEEAAAALARMKYSAIAEEAAAEADIVSESVPEDPELKGRVFGQFNELCPEHTIFTTNTSSLLPSMFAEATGRPEKLVALHFHDVRITNVVDVMPHPGTSDETFEVVRDFSYRIGQAPIVLKREHNGYVFNYMLMEWTNSALRLASKNVASVEDIDRAWMGVLHVPMGPFAIMDSVGLGTVWTVADYWAKRTDNPGAKANADFVKQYVDRGDLGQKTGRGFYEYPGPAYSKPGFLSGKDE